jgi:pyruvate formate-lyase/glycerol dehydratase family glycyl radical enzyme
MTISLIEENLEKVNVLTDRVKRRLHECNNATAWISGQRSYSYMQAWQENKTDPFHLRRAKAFARVMADSPAIIRDGELIVGSETKYIRGAEGSDDYNPYDTLVGLKKGEFQTLSEVMLASIDVEQKALLEEAAHYWVGQSVQDIMYETWRRELGQDYLDLLDDDARVIESVINVAPKGPSMFNPRVLKEGLNGTIARAKGEKELMRHSTGNDSQMSTSRFHKMVILDSIIIACEAVIAFARKHADLAREMAQNEHDPVRRSELEQIADRCERVPADPARNFAEALQSLWFIHLALKKEEPIPIGPCPGRMDQFLYPFFKNDIEESRISYQEAAELLGCLWVKFNELISARAKITNEGSAASLLQQIILGGQTKDGRDTINDLSFLILEVSHQLKTPQPGIYIRWHNGINHDFMVKAAETNRDLGGGIPAYLSEQFAISRMMAMGVSREDAAEWAATACLYYVIPHTNMAAEVIGNINLVKVFEITLNNGFDPRTGKQLGPKTGDVRNFTCIEQLFEAWEKQYNYFLDKLIFGQFIGHSARMERHSAPLTTALSDDTIAKGLDVVEGGERYPQLSILYGDRGHVDIADSLAAIKYLVFDEKKLSMAELMDGLACNFEGMEDVRQLCLHAPKYGNDDDYADDIFNYVSLKSGEIMTRKRNPWTGKPVCWQRPAVSGHYYHGAVVGALPNGRKAWLPINDANFSAMPGMDVNGPSAVIKSATKVNHFPPELNGGILNMKFSPAMLKSRESIEKFLSLLKTFFDRGGWHIQFNITNRQDLLDAQKSPEKWKNLVVRVAGYSAYFVDLPRVVQDEIIARTEHTL